MSEIERRLSSLEGWRSDVGGELRELCDWRDDVSPFLQQLQTDLLYRQRRHAETVGSWSRIAKIAAVTGGILVAISAVGSLIVQLYLASKGATPAP